MDRGDTQGRRTRYGKVWRPPYLDFLTSTPRSSIRLSPSSHRTSVSNVLSRGRGCRKKKYSIGPNEPLFVELGRPMAGSFLVNGPAAGSLCPHRVPPDATPRLHDERRGRAGIPIGRRNDEAATLKWRAACGVRLARRVRDGTQAAS